MSKLLDIGFAYQIECTTFWPGNIGARLNYIERALITSPISIGRGRGGMRYGMLLGVKWKTDETE